MHKICFYLILLYNKIIGITSRQYQNPIGRALWRLSHLRQNLPLLLAQVPERVCHYFHCKYNLTLHNVELGLLVWNPCNSLFCRYYLYVQCVSDTECLHNIIHCFHVALLPPHSSDVPTKVARDTQEAEALRSAPKHCSLTFSAHVNQLGYSDRECCGAELHSRPAICSDDFGVCSILSTRREQIWPENTDNQFYTI